MYLLELDQFDKPKDIWFVGTELIEFKSEKPLVLLNSSKIAHYNLA